MARARSKKETVQPQSVSGTAADAAAVEQAKAVDAMMVNVKLARNASREVLENTRRVTKAVTFGQDVFVGRMQDVVAPVLEGAVRSVQICERALQEASEQYAAIIGE